MSDAQNIHEFSNTVIFEIGTVDNLQRVYLPLENSDPLIGQHARVTLSNEDEYICRIWSDRLLSHNVCVMDQSVRCGNGTGESLKLTRVSIIENVKFIKNLKISVVLKPKVDRSCVKRTFFSSLKRALFLYTIVQNSRVKLLDCFDFLGVAFVLVHNIGNVKVGKVVENTKVVVEKFITWEGYCQSEEDNKLISDGFETYYDQLKKFFEAKKFISSKKLHKHHLPQILVSGPSGSGKKCLVRKVAHDLDATILVLDCSEIGNPQPGESENLLSKKFKESLSFANEGIVILLILRPESICVKPGRILSQFLTLIDSISAVPNLTSVMCCCDPNKLAESVKTSSRFHFEIDIRLPNENERFRMLKSFCTNENLIADHCLKLAELTSGYTVADLALLVRKTARNFSNCEQIFEVFKQNVRSIQPTLLRGEVGLVKEIETSPVGGLTQVKEELNKIIKWPIKYKEAYQRLNLKIPSGCLLYGPPGCAKTSITRLIAFESGLTFFSVSAADLYSPYVGDAEKTVTDLFKKARASAPAILFIDEIDALVGSRGQRQKGAHERILTTFLTEMDGISSNLIDEFSGKVIVIAATNRPQILDSALLRPGRFDKLIYVPPPDKKDRLDILRVLTKSVSLTGVDLETVAENTTLYSGADLMNLCREAAFKAMLTLGVECSSIHYEHFISALKEIRPSLNISQIEFYEKFSFSQNSSW